MKHLMATALATVLLGTNSAIAQAPSSEGLLRAYSRLYRYVDFRARPDSCKGQILSEGLICVLDSLEEQIPGKRLAILNLYYVDTGTTWSSVTSVKVIEMEPNEANVAYVAFINEKILPNYHNPKSSNRPLLFAKIRADGTVSVDTEYGQYPPGFSQKEESARILKQYQGEIRKLIAALAQTR